MSPLSPDRAPHRSRSWMRCHRPDGTVAKAPDRTRIVVAGDAVPDPPRARRQQTPTGPGPTTNGRCSAKGEAQAEGIADHLADAGIKRVISSPSVRCRQTVEATGQAAGHQGRA